MRFRKALALFLAACLLGSCSEVSRETPNFSMTDSEETTAPPIIDDEPQITTIPDIPVEIPDISFEEYSEVFEAEDGNLTENMSVGNTRNGFSGEGYVTGFERNASEHWHINIEIPATQHYDISVFVSSDSPKNNRLYLNDELVGEIITSGGSSFEKITFENIFISNGENKLEIIEVTAAIAFDKIEITANLSTSDINFEVTDSLINENANEKTVKTMQYMVSQYGNKIFSGQFASVGANVEPEKLYRLTGRYPAIRFGDLFPYTITENVQEIGDIEEAVKWSEMGGMVGYIWHWYDPLTHSSCYSEATDFDLSAAVNETDLHSLPLDELALLLEGGEISEECYAIIKDIDAISAQLSILQDSNVTVLWRPLHEASGGWFWWGNAGEEAYFWLWDLMYARMTYYHGLNNLIWIWNGQSPTWYVGDDKCDIISADIYDDGNFSSQLNSFLSLNAISESKLIAMTECSNPLSPENCIRDKAMWSWFGVWGGDYIMNEIGELTDEYTAPEQWIEIYSSEAVLTLENLPDLRIWSPSD